MQKTIVLVVFATSLLFFILGLVFPIMNSEILMGLKKDEAYLFGSIKYFFKEGDYFIGTLILIFSLIFPILKYIVVGGKIVGFSFGSQKWLHALLEIINKWAMLDVFVVALVIVNMKFDKLLISTSIGAGTTYFAISILLLMVSTLLLQKMKPEQNSNDPTPEPSEDTKVSS